MKKRINSICILGGTGFIGHHLTARLANEGYALKLLTRSRERHREFLVMPSARLQQVDNFDSATLEAEFADCDAVINLIGILNGSEADFQRAHTELPTQVAAACQASGATRYLHMSALNATAETAPSQYLRSKGAGQEAVFKQPGIAATCFQPSVVFGSGDGFFQRFSTLLKLSPALPLACPDARFAPVYIADVVSALSIALKDSKTIGQCYQLCGPRIYTLKELVEYTAKLNGQRRLIVGLSDRMSQRQARVFDWMFKLLPGNPPFSLDHYHSMQIDSVGSTKHKGLADLGITPTTVESIMPRLLQNNASVRNRYQQLRSASRR